MIFLQKTPPAGLADGTIKQTVSKTAYLTHFRLSTIFTASLIGPL